MYDRYEGIIKMKQQNAPVLISNQPAISYGDVLTKTADIPTRLSDILERAALKSEKGIVYIQSDGSEQFQSYQNLLEDAQRILGGLRKRGLKPQDKVIFQIEPSQDFIPAFWGCILGGFIPVPISIAPTYQQVNNIVNKLHNAWQMLEQPLVLTNRGLAQNVRFLSRLLNLKDFKVETVDNLRNNEPDHNIYKSQPNDLTLLLLTSGSTGMPKAVMLNHRNLLSMSAGTVQMNDFSSQEVTLNWMALDHVGAIVFLGLMAVDLGCQQIQVPTDFILTNPLKWLELIERHRVSISWAPNFAFSLLNERAQEINQRLWDLSSMGFLVNAGEQIVAKTARNFLKLLQTHGLPSHALRPAFGMSETCSGITWSSGFSLDNSSDEMSFVELGGPIPGASLRIVDENNQIVTEGTIGRFQVKGPSVTEGYYQNPERNREVFSDDGWFNTGDMGYLQDGHLILTGRDKDDIIINGINFYSHEIEAVVEEIEQIEISYTAACAVVMPGDNSDKLAIFFVSLIEDQDFLKALIKQIRGRVVQKVGISPNYLIPVKKEAIPKTAIGKIQRQQLTQRFQAGEFDPIIKKLDIAHDNILQDWLYQIEWRQKIETLTVDLTMRANEQWLILADNQGIGLQLSQLLQNQGAFYTLVRPGKAYQQIDEQTLNIDHTNPEHFQQLLETVSSKPARWRGIVHCWSLDTVVTDQLTREDLEAAGRLGCGSLLYLVQALDKANFSEPPSLWLVTQGAMPVAFSNSDVKGQTIINIAQSPLSGLGKVIALEHPELNCVQIDLDPKTKGEAQVLFDEINLKSQETQMAFRQNARYVPRLIHYHPKEIDDKIDNLFHADSTYLITGGLGDLGLRLALWMVEQGVQHLVLTGRRGASDEAQLMLNQWQLAGVHILVIQADVSDPDEVAKILEKTKISMPPLRGIIHAAGIQDDGLLQQQTWERFSQVMAPKVAGTWNLHLLTQEIPLDFFVCFSSMVSLLGSPAQGSYVVANTFMDAVAHHRRALGLPCLSINWGPWAEVGMAAKLGKPAQRRLTAQGVGRISIDEGIAILRKCMGQQVAQIGVLPINWYLFLPQFFQGIQSPFLEAFTSPPSVANAKQLLNQVRNAVSHEERYTLLVDYLRLQVAKSLGMSQPDIQQPLNQLGLDSLIAVELRNAIRTQLGVELTIGTFLTGASVSKLATEIELQLAATENQANQSQKSIDNSTETYPLSHGQRALWFLYQLAPESAAYNINYVARLRPDLELQALQQAFDKLVERHAILRTIYTTRDGEPVQQVHKAQQIHFKVTEANNWSQEELTQWLDEEADRPFNLEQGPVLRIELLLGFSELPILSLTMHHIVADFWSFEILINELESLYQAIKSKSRISLPPLKWSYKDYVQWETERLAGPRGKPLWAYWEKQLGGELPVLNLPTDHPRPPVQTYNGTTATFDIEESINQQIIEFSKVTGSTPYMFMLAVFQILLRRYTGQEDILIGTPMSGRHTTELQEIMGYFVNTVILRHQLHGNPTFEELLQMVRQQVVEALDHQEYPFGLLVEQLQPIRDPSRSPLYQVAFVWDKERHQDTSNRNASKLVTEILSAEQRGAAFDLSLTFFEQAGHLRGEWTYNTELFEESTINRFTGHLKTLVAGALAHPQQRLSQLPLLTEADQQQLLSWNDTATDYPTDKTIVDLFEEQVEKTPNNIAVVFEQQKLTYQQLNEQANQLAHHLLALKQQAALPDNLLIAIAVERSCDMVIGLLGILKAGGAYVPIDPSYPVARIQYMLEDSRTPVLLTQSHLKTQLPVLAHNCVTVCLDDREFAHQLTVNPTVKRQVTDLAYVIYTSGSTGMPKGCQVTHANVARLFASTEAWYQFNQQDVWTLFHSYAFDFSVWEIWGALFYGAKLVVVPHETSRSPADFYQLLIEQQVTVLNQTPSAFGQLIHQDEQPDKLALRLVIFGGEALDINQLQPWFTRHGEKQPQLVNMYGITETTVHVTYYPLVQPHSYNQSIIGIPLPDLGIWVVDKHNQPLPVGVPGEMLVGGAGVTNGYLNRPELTREKFIEVELFGKTKRIYKTGDLARWLPNGHLEYLGRIDHQVKLRGFRIELGEIEAVLTQHEAVKEAVVILYEADENKRLVVYLTVISEPFVLTNNSLITDNCLLITELKDWLKARLPDYMVPSQFMVLEQLPLTQNGKIDRHALPAPSIETTTSTTLLTPTEELLASLWASVLKLKVVSRDNNFFELGGHSLLATQLIARIREVFEVELPVRAVFEEPKLSQLASVIEEASRGLKLPPISRRPADSKKVLSFAQQRLWFLNQFEGQQQSTYNIPAILRLEGDLDINALQNSLSWLLERHESLTSAFPTKDGQAQVQILPLDKIEVLKIHDFTELPTETQRLEVQNRANHHAIEPFDLSQGPLFKADLLLLSATESVLLLNMHHIISDGWSMGVFIREWQHAYTAFAQGEQPSLPPLEIQYSDYAAWQRDWLQGEILQQQVDYWREQLAGVPELLELPTDKPRPPQQSYQGAHYSQSLSPALSEAVKRLSREQGVTLFMTLLTTFEILLSRYSGQTDVCVGSPIANRTHRQTENLIGFLVNTLVLRAQLQPDLSFLDLLQQNRQTCLEAYTHQDIPFEMLVEKLQPTRSLSHSPLFQVMLVLQNNDTTDLTLPGLEITALEPDYPISKFDLTLSVNEQNEQLHCFWEYATDLFLASTIERMAKHFEMLLTAILENPEQAISQLPMLTDQEIQQLIAWNDTATDYPLDKTIVDLFEEQVEKTPANIAVVFEEQQLTYQQLNEQANQLAHYLLALKNQVQMPDNPLIAIAVERSIEMVIGLLGILKAGGAYVPIDPSYPAARIQYMLEDSQAPVLLTQTHLQAQLPVFTHDCVLVCLDDGEFANQPTVNPSFKRQAGDLAYVIYTSGSTGMPKGVMIEHHNLSNLLLSLQQSTFITISDKLLAVTTLSFDIAALELYLPLISGSLLHLVTREMASDGFILQQLLKYNSFMQATPATWKLLMESDWQAQTPLNILCGGESLPPELANFLLKNSHRLWNVYGPTETTIWSSAYLIQTVSNALVSIGKPIANTHIYILDTQKQPLPPGIPGELCIAGHGLARGYLNRPELTAEKFIEVKIFGKTERIYKTGDLARWLPDGNLEYLGRIDHQVKLRGFRIELGEIETVLTQHEFVKEAVVILYEADENKRLVAYLTIEKAAHDEVAVVKDWLKASLPDYMVPSQFMVLDQLPLTPNGKIDRQALSQLSVDTHSLEKWVAPQTDWEKLLADIWAPVLGVEQVGIHNNFFDLGGHSLQAVQLVSKIALATKIKVSVKQLFLSPTIAQLAKRLEKSVPQPHLIEHNSPVTSQSDNLPVFKGESIVSQSSPYFQLERRSLLSQVLTKKIQPVNAAALGYLPDSILEPTGLNQEQILEQCFENMPVVSNLIDTAWGRIALLLLPRFNSELYGNMNDLVEVTLEALEIAGQMGATTVSLTGMIPSATDYGRAIVKGMADRHLPQITTGHSTTSATVVLTIQKILQAGGRSMARERVGFIGLGSIGFSSLCLMLKCLPHPAELMLCDLYSKKAFLENIREQLVNELGFQGKIQLLFSEVELPKEIYQATLIIGATNVPDVLDISQVQSGTLIVDDSGPHCFNLERAIKRFEEHQDILFTEGGVLKSPQPITETLYFPHHWEKHLPILSEYAIKYNPFEITGCVFSSVLSSYHQLKPTVGLVQLDESVKHFETLKRMDFQAADLHGENYVLPLEAISHFRERFAMS
jgi:amino acid adenylation domain-containing protein